jgi:hypothetical protein
VLGGETSLVNETRTSRVFISALDAEHRATREQTGDDLLHLLHQLWIASLAMQCSWQTMARPRNNPAVPVPRFLASVSGAPLGLLT